MAPCVPEVAQSQARPEQPIPRGPWPFLFPVPWSYASLQLLFLCDVPLKIFSMFVWPPLPPAFVAPLVVRAGLSFGSLSVVLLVRPFAFLALVAVQAPGALPCFYQQIRSCVNLASMRLGGR